jgi:gliding motility-associated-like protein
MQPMFRKFITFLLFVFMSTAVFGQNKAPESNVVENCPIRMPNAFTPNDDGVNDFFYFTFLDNCLPTRYSLQIFDRYGRLVFETKDYLEKWDGRFDGQNLNDGAYFWVMSVDMLLPESKDETRFNKKGSVLIVR